jgi:hypothetical protein
MGEKDADALHKIYEKIKTYCKENDLSYSFKVDDGSFETAIEFWALGYHHPPRSENWEISRAEGNEIKCPDLLDINHKLIIEYEEEGQKRLSGARLARKGHGPKGDMPNKRDTDRDHLYRIGGFKLLRFYEADLKEQNWDKLYNFLLNCKSE